MARAIMLQGTGSSVGKTVLVAGLCRVARNRGIKVVPFKPQNMSNNAAVSDDGGEIGRSQWLQATAAGIASSVHMNPVLLKPQSETSSQIIVHGRVYDQKEGQNYQKIKGKLLEKVMQSYRCLQEDADLILTEGAGSPAEINLRDGDIANMGFATAVDIPVILVGDIDRGGVIASIVGTHTVLADKDRRLIAGYMINKFRGDPMLFKEGISAILAFTGWHSFGTIPWLADAITLPEEDSFLLDRLSSPEHRKVRIAIPVTSSIANFDDFDPLRSDKDVKVLFVRYGQVIPEVDAILLAGSKSTISDMKEFHDCGWSEDIRHHARRGGEVIGLCGGFQMLGRTIIDLGEKGDNLRKIAGIGLLDIETVLQKTKIVRNVTGYAPLFGNVAISGYEIHLGKTTGPDCARAPIVIEGKPDGASSHDGLVWGTYVHGIFSGGSFRKKFLKKFGADSDGMEHYEKIDEALEKIATTLEKVIDIDTVFALAR